MGGAVDGSGGVVGGAVGGSVTTSSITPVNKYIFQYVH